MIAIRVACLGLFSAFESVMKNNTMEPIDNMDLDMKPLSSGP